MAPLAVQLIPPYKIMITLSTALRFDGVDDVVTIADNSAYSQPTTGAITISAWMNPDTLVMPNPEKGHTPGNYTHWMSKKDSNQNEWAFRMYNTGNTETPTRFNRISFYIFSLSGGEGSGAAFEDEVIPGQWIHVLGTVDAQYVSIFKNGVFQNKEDWVAFPVTLAEGTAPVRIGGRANDGFFKGMIDNVQIWNRVLTNDEISRLYREGETPSSGLVADWKMNEGSGTTVTDSSTTANNGTITGATYVTGLTQSRQPVSNQAFDNFGALDINRTNSYPRRKRVQAMSKSIELISTSSQYLTITDAAQSGLDVGTHDFIIGGWFLIKDRGALQMLMAKYSGASFANNASGVGWELMFRGDLASKGLQFRFNDGTSTGTTFTFSRYKLIGKWAHISIVVQRAGTVEIYINGIRYSAVDASMASETGTFSSSGDFFIGRQSGTGTTQYGNFCARDLFLYDLGDAGVTDFPTVQHAYIEPIYFRGQYPTSKLVSHWTLDNTLADDYGGNTLTSSGSPSFSSDVPLAVRTAS